MCGIFGIIRAGAPTTAEEREALADLMDGLATMSASRGTHSTGVARVTSATRPTVAKAALAAWQMVATPAWADAVEAVEAGTVALLGHTRYATHGAVTAENAHPFAFERDGGRALVGVHNGIVHNYEQLAPGHEVDSAALMAALAGRRPGKWAKVLHRVEGSAAVAVAEFHPKDGVTVMLARNGGSPLYTARLKDGTVVFASTEAIVRGALEATGMEVKRAPQAMPAGEARFFRVEGERLTCKMVRGWMKPEVLATRGWEDVRRERSGVATMPAPRPAHPPVRLADVADRGGYVGGAAHNTAVKVSKMMCGGCGGFYATSELTRLAGHTKAVRCRECLKDLRKLY